MKAVSDDVRMCRNIRAILLFYLLISFSLFVLPFQRALAFTTTKQTTRHYPRIYRNTKQNPSMILNEPFSDLRKDIDAGSGVEVKPSNEDSSGWRHWIRSWLSQNSKLNRIIDTLKYQNAQSTSTSLGTTDNVSEDANSDSELFVKYPLPKVELLKISNNQIQDEGASNIDQNNFGVNFVRSTAKLTYVANSDTTQDNTVLSDSSTPVIASTSDEPIKSALQSSQSQQSNKIWSFFSGIFPTQVDVIDDMKTEDTLNTQLSSTMTGSIPTNNAENDAVRLISEQEKEDPSSIISHDIPPPSLPMSEQKRISFFDFVTSIPKTALNWHANNIASLSIAAQGTAINAVELHDNTVVGIRNISALVSNPLMKVAQLTSKVMWQPWETFNRGNIPFFENKIEFLTQIKDSIMGAEEEKKMSSREGGGEGGSKKMLDVSDSFKNIAGNSTAMMSKIAATTSRQEMIKFCRRYMPVSSQVIDIIRSLPSILLSEILAPLPSPTHAINSQTTSMSMSMSSQDKLDKKFPEAGHSRVKSVLEPLHSSSYGSHYAGLIRSRLSQRLSNSYKTLAHYIPGLSLLQVLLFSRQRKRIEKMKIVAANVNPQNRTSLLTSTGESSLGTNQGMGGKEGNDLNQFSSLTSNDGSFVGNEYPGSWVFHGWNWEDSNAGSGSSVSTSTSTSTTSSSSSGGVGGVMGDDKTKITARTNANANINVIGNMNVLDKAAPGSSAAQQTATDLSHLVSSAAAYKFLPVPSNTESLKPSSLSQGNSVEGGATGSSSAAAAITASTVSSTAASVTTKPAASPQLHKPLRHFHQQHHNKDATTFKAPPPPPSTSTSSTASSATSTTKSSTKASGSNDITPSEVKSTYFTNTNLKIDESLIPRPSQTDFLYMDLNRHTIAVTAALGVVTESDAKDYLRYVGLQPLIDVLTQPIYRDLQVSDINAGSVPSGDPRVEAVKGICRIIRAKKDVADTIGAIPEVIEVLIDLMEAPIKRFSWISYVERDKKLRAQREATALVQRLVRSSDQAVRCLRQNDRLHRVLHQIIALGDKKLFAATESGSNSLVGSGNHHSFPGSSIASSFADLSIVSNRRKHAKTKIVDFDAKLSTPSMARVAAWGLGGVPWKPKYPGHKGLRILSFDGGGTRGVVSIAFLKELLQRAGKTHPHELFDIVCGTSTGGILAVLIGGQRAGIEESEAAYDSFIDKIFAARSNLRLVQEQAAYDEQELEKVLYSFTGDELLLDTNKHDAPRIFCVSTKANNNPPLIHLWRNYNYPPKLLPEQESRYGGHFRINSATAVRATTAAPTYFTPVRLEDGGLYCDGALVANNPTAVAVQEAKAIFPNVPIEYVVSVGTGFIDQHNNASDLGWNLLVNQIIASSVDTEDVHHLLRDFMSPDQYFRLNLPLQENLSIDEKNKTILSNLKKLARQEFERMEKQPRMQNLIKSLTETPSNYV